MSAFGFSFQALYRLDVAELQDLARLIRGSDYYPPRTKDALIRGVIIPFLRKAAGAAESASKDAVMRAALIRVARSLKVACDDWDQADTVWIVRQVKLQWQEKLRRHLKDLSQHEREAILNTADEELKKRAQRAGLTLLPATGVLLGEASGFGVYIATTTGLGALSTAIGVTFPWAVYQGATTLLGVMLGPTGWVLIGAAVVTGGGAAFAARLKRERVRLEIVVLAIIAAIGENSYEWFGLSETASLQECKSAYRAMMKTLHPDRLEQKLPDWLKHQFNELLLRTQENYERIQQHKEEMSP